MMAKVFFLFIALVSVSPLNGAKLGFEEVCQKDVDTCDKGGATTLICQKSRRRWFCLCLPGLEPPTTGVDCINPAAPITTAAPTTTAAPGEVTVVTVVNRTCIAEPEVPDFYLPLGICSPRNDSCKHELVDLSNGQKIMCDTETDGGGWIIVQRRSNFKNGSNFFQSEDFNDYKNGFGDMENNFWIGLETMHRFCPPKKPCEMRTDFIVKDGTEDYVKGKNISFEGAWDNYRIRLEYDGKLTGGTLPFEDANDYVFESPGNPGLFASCVETAGGWWQRAGCVTASLNGPMSDRFTFSEIKLRRPAAVVAN